MARRSTDVHGSIAGYYYQVLLACKELTRLVNDDDCVGVEAGADVRIVKNGNKMSMEAKFHKNNMHDFHPEIIKTIYNFYLNSAEDSELVFRTNVSLTKNEYKKLLIEDWQKPEADNEKCNYIKKCLLRYCICNEKKDIFEKYKEEIKSKEKIVFEGNKLYIEKLETEIFDEKTKEYEDYSILRNDMEFLDFANKVKFEFENLPKIESIKNLRIDIINNIKSNYLQGKVFQDEVEQDIVNVLVYEFFEIITRNSQKTKPKYNELEKFYVGRLKECINKYNELLEKYNLLFEKGNILNAFETVEDEFFTVIEDEYEGKYSNQLCKRFHEIMNGFHLYIRNEKNYDHLVYKYSVGENVSWNAILKVILQTTVLSVFNNCNYDDVFFEEDGTLNNIYIRGLIKYCFKHYDSEVCRKSTVFIKKFMQSIELSKLSSEQIVVISSTGFRDGGRPCEQRRKIEEEAYIIDCAKANKEDYRKYLTFIRNIDYKCDQCIIFDDDDDVIQTGINKFLKQRCGD